MEIKEIKEKIQETEKEFNELKNNLSKLNEEINKLDEQRRGIIGRLTQLQGAYEALNGLLPQEEKAEGLPQVGEPVIESKEEETK